MIRSEFYQPENFHENEKQNRETWLKSSAMTIPF